MRSEKGNVLFLILIAVALFAALSYVVSGSMGSGASSAAGNEKALISSSEVMQYGSAVENGVMRMKVSHNCALDQISFEHSPFDGSDTDYINPNSPPDFSCHVFHPAGGRISPQPPPVGVNDGRDWAYVDRTIMGIGADQTACGSDCNELVMVLGGISRSTCEKINEKVTGSKEIPLQNVGGNYDQYPFQGSFSSYDYIGYGAKGQARLCIEDDFGHFYYYHVLAPR